MIILSIFLLLFKGLVLCEPRTTTNLFFMEDLNEATENCTGILESFAESSSNFTLCSLKYAQPVRLCEKCINHYIAFKEKYDDLVHTVINGTSCKSLFISQDRLEVVLAYYNNILSVWNKGNCKACYDWSSKQPVLSNDTLYFNQLYDKTKKCISSNMKENNTEQVCQACMHPYLQLDQYYLSLSSDAIGVDSVCMDVVDSMNTTRSIWSKTLKCCQLRKTPEIIFLCCSGIISLLPILYYLVLRYCGPMRELPNILKQTRFKQTFLRPGHGRIN